MSSSPSPRAARPRPRPALVAALLLVLVLVAVLTALIRGSTGVPSSGTPPRPALPALQAAQEASQGTAPVGRRAAAGTADGVVPDGVTVLDDRYPAIADLAPSLLRALRDAARDAAAEGVELDVNSGWRSRWYQERLFQEAVKDHGSVAAATRWVARPGTSAHEAGEAVDLGHEAADWLARHGARFGLCRTYANEPWHYELRPTAVDHGCPAVYADPVHDPRTSR